MFGSYTDCMDMSDALLSEKPGVNQIARSIAGHRGRLMSLEDASTRSDGRRLLERSTDSCMQALASWVDIVSGLPKRVGYQYPIRTQLLVAWLNDWRGL
jgi:hypothetical protein